MTTTKTGNRSNHPVDLRLRSGSPERLPCRAAPLAHPPYASGPHTQEVNPTHPCTSKNRTSTKTKTHKGETPTYNTTHHSTGGSHQPGSWRVKSTRLLTFAALGHVSHSLDVAGIRSQYETGMNPAKGGFSGGKLQLCGIVRFVHYRVSFPRSLAAKAAAMNLPPHPSHIAPTIAFLCCQSATARRY